MKQIVVALGKVSGFDEFGVIGDHAGVVVSAGPVSFFVLEVVEKSAPFRRVIFLKQFFLENLVELETRCRENIKEVDSAAMFLKDFYYDLCAAEAKQLWLNERIFFLESVHHSGAVSNIGGAIVDKSLLFLGLSDRRTQVLSKGNVAV